MKDLNRLAELDNAECTFSLDWSLIDKSAFLEICSHPKISLISNLSVGIIKFIKIYDQAVLKEIEGLILEFPELRAILIEELGIPTSIKAKYFPDTDIINPIDSSVPDICTFTITEDTKKTLNEIKTELDDGNGFSVELHLQENSIFRYTDRSTKPSLNSVLRESSIAASIVVAASLASGFLSSKDLLDSSSESMNNSSNLEFTLTKKNSSLVKLESSINSLYRELSIKEIRKSVPSLESINSEEIADLYGIFHFKDKNLFDDEMESSEVKPEKVAKIISEYYKKSQNDQIEKIANAIVDSSKNKKIDYKLMIAIIKVESSFNQSAVSSTGDLSVAQINYEQWNKEFQRLGHEKLNKEKLKSDIDYSVEKMAEILKILAERHKNDELWYARYHSGTPSRKIGYANKVKKELAHIEKSVVADVSQNIVKTINELSILRDSTSPLKMSRIEKIDEVIKELVLLNSQINVMADSSFRDKSSETVLAFRN